MQTLVAKLQTLVAKLQTLPVDKQAWSLSCKRALGIAGPVAKLVAKLQTGAGTLIPDFEPRPRFRVTRFEVLEGSFLRETVAALRAARGRPLPY